ncbi:MAG: ATP-binding protein [Elusimicrobiota bacterium]
MAETTRLLIAAQRPEVLESLYSAPLASAFNVTVAPAAAAFEKIMQRFPFDGFVVDAALADPGAQWKMFQDVKLRHPEAFFAFLPDKSTREAAEAWPGGGPGWHVLHSPFETPAARPVDLAGREALVFRHPEAARDSAFAEVEKHLSARTAFPTSLQDALRALQDKPGASLLMHVPACDTPLAVFLKEVYHRHPQTRALIFVDETLEASTGRALRSRGWTALPAERGLPYLLERLQAGDRPAAAPAKDRVLVAEDEPHLLEWMMDMLSDDYDVEGFPNGAAAAAAMKEKEYHAALVDFQLGDTTGLALAREFHKVDDTLPVILMTAHASLDMAVKALQAGIYDYIIKPVDTGHLRNSLSKALAQRRLARENRALLADLTKANQSLSRLNQLQSKFLSIVTHDLRTPLTAIKGYAQVLAMQEFPEEKKRDFAGVIAREADQLGLLINDLMDVAGLEAGKLRVEKSSQDPRALLQNVRRRMEPLARERGIVFTDGTDGAVLPPVQADGRRVEQVLTNLIGNAFKHTPSGGRVTMAAAARDGRLRVEVADTGEGIPLADLKRVFERFFQVEAHASKREGLGLGLTIAKEIIQAHGGDIGVNSDGPGKGAVFWFTLPCESKPDQPDSPLGSRDST